ncbi:MAG: outer membrane beta-barrel protein [Acinetobacter populi]|jgi:outer membrane protein|uniref:OmpW/AlkL family protein n=1 Tax=Acinetobacter populi TaxID=1582270 RepID=UPI002353EA62|nr:OmpW family outer membrane protein [Acinetobacter populi]MCH4248146.1 outer membrane beta-barrel protein [Acinetobacter populi]
MLKKALITGLLVGMSSVAMAGPWTVKAGVSLLNPTAESDLVGGAVKDAKATNEFNFTPSVEYRFGETPFSVELLLAAPFNQDVKMAGGTKIAELKHLPPTLTAKYNFPTYHGFTPYVGAGVTVLIPWDEKLTSAAKGALGLTDANKLEADTSVGAAGQIGFVFQPADAKNWGVFADVRYADLDTDLKVKGVGNIGTLDINPLVYTLGYSYNF